MNSGDLIEVSPRELIFPFEAKKSSSCVMHLRNRTDQYVAFKVKATNPKRYAVHPNIGIVLPGSTSGITVMQYTQEAPPDLQCRDKFLLQCVLAKDGATTKDITTNMFEKEPGKITEEFKLRVSYLRASAPSPVQEEAEECLLSRSCTAENGTQSSSLLDDDSSMVSKLTADNASEIQLQQKLSLQESELLHKEERNRRRTNGYSIMHVLLFGLLSFLVGYIFNYK